jgi:DNA polymerase/3'-5' exonuclease PolX
MKTKILYQEAVNQTAEIMRVLIQYCEPGYCEYAGSIRRRCETVGDVEVVCVPKTQQDLFGDPGASLLRLGIDELISKGQLSTPTKNGDKYKQFIIQATGQQLDLFITTKEQWPVIFAIRTGSAEFSRRLVTTRQHGGLLPSHLNVKEGRVWNNGAKVELKTERDFLELCGGWIEPERRK